MYARVYFVCVYVCVRQYYRMNMSFCQQSLKRVSKCRTRGPVEELPRHQDEFSFLFINSFSRNKACHVSSLSIQKLLFAQRISHFVDDCAFSTSVSGEQTNGQSSNSINGWGIKYVQRKSSISLQIVSFNQTKKKIVKETERNEMDNKERKIK